MTEDGRDNGYFDNPERIEFMNAYIKALEEMQTTLIKQLLKQTRTIRNQQKLINKQNKIMTNRQKRRIQNWYKKQLKEGDGK